MYITLTFCIAVNKLHLFYKCDDPDDNRQWKRIEEFATHHTEEEEKEDENLTSLLSGGHCIDI